MQKCFKDRVSRPIAPSNIAVGEHCSSYSDNRNTIFVSVFLFTFSITGQVYSGMNIPAQKY